MTCYLMLLVKAIRLIKGSDDTSMEDLRARLEEMRQEIDTLMERL